MHTHRDGSVKQIDRMSTHYDHSFRTLTLSTQFKNFFNPKDMSLNFPSSK